MNTSIKAAFFASALCLAFACGDDDDNQAGTGGSHSTGGNAGNPGTGGKGSAGENPAGGATSEGGTSAGGAAPEAGAGAGGAAPEAGTGAGGANAASGAGGTSPEGGAAGTITCEAPPPPVTGDAGGASSAGGAAGAGGEGGARASGELAISGVYTDNFSGSHAITSSEWVSGSSTYHISTFSNAAHFIVAQNDQGNTYNPCLWSRFDWTEANGKLYYCTTAYNAMTEAAALATPAADATDPATTGCGSFAWTELTPD